MPQAKQSTRRLISNEGPEISPDNRVGTWIPLTVTEASAGWIAGGGGGDTHVIYTMNSVTGYIRATGNFSGRTSTAAGPAPK